MFEYSETRRQTYEDGMVFVPVCPVCGRFVKADETVTVNGLGEYVSKPNSTCSKCGRVEMPFEGFMDF
jgi:hypothetical protein